MTGIDFTLGPLLLGGSIALVLSGMVTVQCIVFYKLYPNEIRLRIGMVFLIWILDFLHSAFIVTSLFDYFIKFFGDVSRTDFIPWSIASFVTAITYAHRTHVLRSEDFQMYALHTTCFSLPKPNASFTASDRNWWITAPIIVLAFLRLLAASVSTTEMIRLHRYSAFNEKYPWVSSGYSRQVLSLSAGVDIIITFFLCYFLRKLAWKDCVDAVRPSSLELELSDGLIHIMTSGSACRTISSFLGLHFVIGKLYANSCLISLNTRKALREMRWSKNEWDPAVPALSPDDFHGHPHGHGHGHNHIHGAGSSAYAGLPSFSLKEPASSYRPEFKVSPAAFPLGAPLQVTVQRTVARSSDDLTDVPA
ncbi:hypothetical protein C8F01DRAFT_1377745 [Mycena amicta]|nr:hypothetical protein C8F01DRAFT_1377745 [Mycena amicta]